MPYKDPEKRRKQQNRYNKTPKRKLYVKNWRSKNREKINTYQREWRKNNPLIRGKSVREYNREYNKKWRKENGYHNEIKWMLEHELERKAQGKLRDRVRRGKIKRMPCEICGEKRSQGHHDDYNKPLEVRWLCALHHKRHHMNIL